ncbi:S-adenosyl-L-methionine-dependent methyltransferase [Mycena sp. CBHHK59/15]|nr:S-adenosyl-L-methionine-dependent methyltransferase [Mycena sp. CBHHK59/15]
MFGQTLLSLSYKKVLSLSRVSLETMAHPQSNLDSYTLKTAQERAENERLNEVHLAFREYLENKICLAPVYNTSPTRILELGCGSGAWAMDAAIDFPNAQVVAVDLSLLPEGPLPNNMEFKVVNLTKALPFEEQTFDIIHARMVLIHVSRFELSRIATDCRLVKPGGWLVVEDFDISRMLSGGPVVSQVIGSWIRILQARGADAELGKKMEPIIQSSGMFSEINTTKIAIPICNNGSAPKNLTRLGLVFNATVQKLVDDWAQRFAAEGVTKELAEQYKKEIKTNVQEVIVDMHFVCAQRAL